MWPFFNPTMKVATFRLRGLISNPTLHISTHRTQKHCFYLSPLHQDADGVCHKLVGHLQDFMWQCGRYEVDLSGRRQVAVDIVDLLFKTWDRQTVRLLSRPENHTNGRMINNFCITSLDKKIPIKLILWNKSIVDLCHPCANSLLSLTTCVSIYLSLSLCLHLILYCHFLTCSIILLPCQNIC